MKVAIIGRSELMYDTAIKLLNAGFEIPIIITAKEAPEYKRTIRDFEKLAQSIDATFFSTAKINKKEIKNEIKRIKNLKIAVSVNYSGIIPNEIIDLFDIGILNAHGGDLPRYRGNACQAWAILNGEEKIGLCIHKMIGDELDSGDIICKKYLKININTKIGYVFDWMNKNIPDMFLDAIKKLEQNENYILEKQSKNKKDILRCYPRTPEDGLINWYSSNVDIIRLINASSEPFSGAFSFIDGEKIIIIDAIIYEDEENWCGIPGQVALIKNDGVVVLTGKGKILIRKIKINDKEYLPNEIIKSTRKRFYSYY